MSTPNLDSDQRATGAQRSLELRQQRADLKAFLKLHGPTSLAYVLTLDPAQGMKVKALLTALPGVGSKRAESLLDAAGIPVGNTVKRCGPMQKARLLGMLG